MKAHDFSCNTQRGPLRSREVTTKLEDTYKSKYYSVRIGKKKICIELFISLKKKLCYLSQRQFLATILNADSERSERAALLKVSR